MSKKFRPCAGAIVFNKQGLVFLGNRIETPTSAWQFPQGGIEANETPLQAAKRELFEETGITSVIPVYTDETPSRYEFDEKIKLLFQKRGIFNDGQDIYFTLFFFNGDETEINVKTAQPEFSEYSWKSMDFAVENIIDFKKNVYESARERLYPIILQYLQELS